MGHPHAGVAGRNVHIVRIAGVFADEGQTIDGFHYLAGPLIFHVLHHGETLARPGLQSSIPRFTIVGLPCSIVLTTDDKHGLFSSPGRTTTTVFAHSGRGRAYPNIRPARSIRPVWPLR